MDDLTRVRSALRLLAERDAENTPGLSVLEARAARMADLPNLTALAARHPRLTPEQLASWIDYAVAIGGDAGSAHDGGD